MGLLKSPDGQIVNVPDDQVGPAVASGYEQVSLGQAADVTTAQPANDTGALGTVGAAASSLLSGATLGGSDVAFKHLLTPGQYKQLAADREDHSWVSGAGQFVGTLAPALLSGGATTPAGYLSSVTAKAAEGGLAEGLVAGGIEGSLQNAGAYLGDAALGDRETTAEGMAGALGTGFAFGAGGGLAAHGVIEGSIAARRMFSRVMDGGAQAAEDAAQAWRSTSQDVLDAHEQAAEIARGKLSNAQRAREEATIARDQAAAGVADAKLAAPAADAAHAQAAGLDEAIGKVSGQEAAESALPPQRVPDDLAAFAARAASEPPPLSPEAAHDLAQKVDAYTEARREFDDVRSKVDTDLDGALTHLPSPEIGWESNVPVGEFGAPGQGGIKTQGELGRLAADRGSPGPEVTPSSMQEPTKAGRPTLARGTPIGEHPALDVAPDPIQSQRDRLEAGYFDEVKSAYRKAREDAVLRGSNPDTDPAALAIKDVYRRRFGAEYEDLNIQSTSDMHSNIQKLSDERSAIDFGSDPDNAGELLKREKQIRERMEQLWIAIRNRGELVDAVEGKPGSVMAVSDSNGGLNRAIELRKTDGGFIGPDGVTWKVSDRGVGNSYMAYTHNRNRVLRIMGESAPETRIGYIDDVPHLFERTEPTTTRSDATTNPLIRAWVGDLASEHLPEGVPSGPEPGPQLRRALSGMTDGDAKRYLTGLNSAYQNNKSKIDRVIEASGLSAEAIERSKTNAGKQIKWLLSAGGGIAALTGGAVVASAGVPINPERGQREARPVGSTATEPRFGKPTTGELAESTGPIEDHRITGSRTEISPSVEIADPGAEREQFSLPEVVTHAPDTELERALRGTKDQLDAGVSLGKISAESPAAAQYVSDKAALREQQAKDFRNAANRRNFEASAMGADEHAAQPETDLERRLRGTRDALDSGKSMREIRAIGTPVEQHPLAIRQLEIAHDAAVERAAETSDPAARHAALNEAMAIERQMTAVGARPGAVEDIAAMAGVTTKMERAAANMVEALGPEAPVVAQKAAAAFRDAEAAADRKMMARIAREADAATAETQGAASAQRARQRGSAIKPDVVVDPATGERRLVHPETGELSPPLGPPGKDRNPGPSGRQLVDNAREAKLRADAELARARTAEGRARIEARDTAAAAKGSRAKVKAETLAHDQELHAVGITKAHQGGHGGKLMTALKVAGAASAIGIPGIPSLHDIPVIGPLLSAYVKYRTLKAAAGRFVGRVPATADSRAAALAAKMKDAIARSVDRSLGIVEANKTAVRASMVAAGTRAADALQRRAFDDGLPDTPKGASVSELAAVRMREVAAAATQPQLVVKMVRQQMRGVIDPDLIQAAENHLMAMYQHLNEVAPKGPPPNPYTVKPWQPSPAEAMQFGRVLAVANDPRVAFDALHSQTLTPDMAETLRAIYPKLFAAAQQRLIERAADLKDPVPYRQRMQNSLLFDVTLDASLDPGNAAILRMAHVQIAPAPGPGSPGPSPGAPPVPSVANPTNLSSMFQQTTADRPGMR